MAGPFSISSLFRNTQQVQVAPGSQQQLQQQPQGTPGSTMQQRNDPTNPQQQPQNPQNPQGTGAPANSPLDQFKDLWQDPDPSKAVADPFANPLFSTDPAKIREAASQMDFTQGLPQELLQKVLQGNDPQALMQVINHVGQQSLAAALQIGTQTIENAGSRIGARFKEAIPQHVRDFQINNTKPSNPMFEHPAIQGMLQRAKQQIKAQNPTMSAEQVAAMAEDYITQTAAVFNNSGKSSNPDGTGSPNSESNFDWMNWAMSGPNSGS